MTPKNNGEPADDLSPCKELEMLRPRMKPELRPRRVGATKIRVGGLIHGVGSEIADPDGHIWQLMELLNGTRDCDQIARALAGRTPLTEDDVREGIASLIGAGFLEDANDPDQALLTPDQQERYSRSRSFFSWVDRKPRSSRWHAQLALRDARVAIVGVGGTGGAAALALAASGVGQIHLVEHDRVELSNLNRQTLYRESDVGRPKVEVAMERLSQANREVLITGEQRKVVSEAEIRELIAGIDCLVVAADHPPEIRSWANRACLRESTPWVVGGYQGAQISTGIFRPGTGPCYECIEHEQEDARASWPVRTDLATLTEPSVANAATAASATISGNLLAHAAICLITGTPQMPVNRLYANSLVRLDHSFSLGADGRHDACLACRG